MYQTARFFFKKEESGRFGYGNRDPKTNRLVCRYLIVNYLMLFKPFKTHQKFVKKC